MNNLSPEEQDVLARIEEKVELQPIFFRKAKKLKWYDALEKRGYFDPVNNPAPKPAREAGYVSIPSWPAIEYLVKVSPELQVEGNCDYAVRILNIIRAVTRSAIDSGLSNYRTWLQFSKIIQNMPIDLISTDDLVYVDYWLDDRYDRDLVSSELGEKWLVVLLNQENQKANDIGMGLLKILYKTLVVQKEADEGEQYDAIFRSSNWLMENITQKAAGKSGQSLGKMSVDMFSQELKQILNKLGSDGWSYIWRPAIEDNDQNHSIANVENILVMAFRDSLDAYVKLHPAEVKAVVLDLLGSCYQIKKRVAIHTITQNYQLLENIIDKVITEDHFRTELQHEMWRLLNARYSAFPNSIKVSVEEIISKIGERNNLSEKDAAYRKAIWFSAVETYDQELRREYRKCIDAAGTEPDHPDFPVFWTRGAVVHESPKSEEELIALSVDELVSYLSNYEDPGNYSEPGIEGLVNALKLGVKAAPLKIFSELDKFASLDNAYMYVLVEAFSDLWEEKRKLPWDEMWSNVLRFVDDIINREEFWSSEDSKYSNQFVGNRAWVVGAIGRLIEKGTKSDSHAFSPEFLDRAKAILLILLDKQSGEEFVPSSDAVSIAINYPRGRCLEALINLALYSCRISDKVEEDHTRDWNKFRPVFDEELNRTEKGEYEFVTLMVNYLPNFLYMSSDWTISNLSTIFDRKDYQRWLCAMQAFAFVSQFYPKVYNYLKENDHFIQALDDSHIRDKVSEKIIQHVVFSFLSSHESIQDHTSLIRMLLDRDKVEELSQIVWFIWTIRGGKNRDMQLKVIELWEYLSKQIDVKDQDGRKLASRMITWSVFIDSIDDSNRDLILQIAQYAEEDYNSSELLNLIARVSELQPKEAIAIWQAHLKGSTQDYQEDEIRLALRNIVESGKEGKRHAEAIAAEYIRQGFERPSMILGEILS